jgi:hypothetical protein
MPFLVVSITFGNQVPVIPSMEEAGKVGAILPLQNAAIGLNVGFVLGVIDTLNVVVFAHCPAFGVKVYTPFLELSIVAGDQVPVIPSKETKGNIGDADFSQNGGIAVNVGVVF